MKIIAFYLPQFHTFPENDSWWGAGFTEWKNVRKALPLFEGHDQPRVPLHHNYYDLTNSGILRRQAELAVKYGIYGFCYYHYWFEGKLLMERPMELMLHDKSVNIPFCISWVNENWTRAWALKNREILMKQTYGDEKDWEKHFYYLLPFLKDERYIRIEDEPIFIIYRPELVGPLYEMISLWKQLAVKNGLKGIKLIYQQVFFNHQKDKGGELFDYGIEYQPTYVRRQQMKTMPVILRKVRNEVVTGLHLPQTRRSTITYGYDDTWRRILRMCPKDDKMIPGAFVDWDNTPRYQKKASLCTGFTIDKFEKYLAMQIKRAKEVYHKDMLFMFAWNEWGEGGYLEPDMRYGYGRLEALEKALMKNI